jgi:glycosyltransferase involved in cell wall biosynthesis
MRILICTQKVDHTAPVLGFFTRWIEEFAKQGHELIVCALQVNAEYVPPKGVQVVSLGKDAGKRKFGIISKIWKVSLQKKGEYDAIFVHMNPEYIVGAGWLWKILRKPIFLWYTHRSVPPYLRIAECFVEKIFTASGKSLRFQTSKKVVMGHGIDTTQFSPGADELSNSQRLLMVGRICETKGQKILFEAWKILQDRFPSLELSYIGKAAQQEGAQEYSDDLMQNIRAQKHNEHITVLDSIQNSDMPLQYRKASLVVNLSKTGSLDKDVLEALACEVSVITTNEAFLGLLEGEEEMFIPMSDLTPELLAEQISKLLQESNEIKSIRAKKLRERIAEKHNLNHLIESLVNNMEVSL